jgi:hypothetical protein
MIIWEIKCNKGDGNEGAILQRADTSTHSSTFTNQKPVATEAADPIKVLKIIYRDKKINFDSLREVWNSHRDSVDMDIEILSSDNLLDSLMRVRNYSYSAGDSLISIKVMEKVVGYSDSVSITWRHNLKEIRMPSAKRTLGVGAIFGKDLASPLVIYNDKKKRQFLIGYNFLNSTPIGGIAITF